MCSGPMVCHGDKALRFADAYTDEQKATLPKEDCKPAVFYITANGEYAVDADFISEEELRTDKPGALDGIPMVKLTK